MLSFNQSRTKMNIVKLVLWMLAASPLVTHAGPYTAKKNIACPSAWENTEKTIPTINQSTAIHNSPWGIAPSTDKAVGQGHITAAPPVVTVDGTLLTELNVEDDLLTIASECLKHRNFEVDTYNYVAPSPPTPNTATGWIPAALF